MDNRAINYNPSATVADASCIYPTLEIDFDLKLGNSDFEINRIYNIGGHNTAFKVFQFYVSNLQLVRSDQTMVNYDSLYPLIKTGQTTVPLGEVYMESYEHIQFKVGIEATTNHQIASYLNDPTHPLRLQSPDTMHFNTNDGYIFLRMEGRVDRNGDGIPNQNEAFDFRIGSDQLLKTIDLALQKKIRKEVESITIAVDVAELLKQVDLQTDQQTHTANNLSLATKIANNIPSAIYIP
ncbi:MbnP family protein [Aureispira anguillae]|uniref:MbnP family protein n=1 Tax=Aureispira anguillae TaxID=2864201 RepID=UPI0022323C75|nr:MbnP family protein [Aureispira anguillae]